jgi:Active DUF488-N3 subclade
MSLDDAAVERIGVVMGEGEDLSEIARLLRVLWRVLPEAVVEGRASEPRHASRAVAGRHALADIRDVGSTLAGPHNLQHGRAARRRCQQRHAILCVWHTLGVGLGRTTRFAPLPPGARRVSVMRAGAAGIKALAPSTELLTEFQERKGALVRAGTAREVAHRAAHEAMGYRERYLAEIKSSPDAIAALRVLIAEARTSDVYVMCMCPYRTPGRACHTYALLDFANELDPAVRLLPEPAPRGVRL